jgi:hypothetical protein
MTRFQLHDMVALTETIEASRFPGGGAILLRRGQVGTIVDELANGEAYEIEFSQSDGQAYAMLAVRAEQLMPLFYEPVELATAG